jgi:predicted HTH domain antitoxin
MKKLEFDVPEEAMRTIADTPQAFARAMRLAAATYWYGRGDMTMGTAAALAGMSQSRFMHALKEAGLPTTDEDLNRLDAELDYLMHRRQPGGVGG